MSICPACGLQTNMCEEFSPEEIGDMVRETFNAQLNRIQSDVRGVDLPQSLRDFLYEVCGIIGV